MNNPNPYTDFTDRLKLLISKHPDLITTTLSNIFTMRLIGNKTHGDLAEIAIAEFVNQYMYDFRICTTSARFTSAKTSTAQSQKRKILRSSTRLPKPSSSSAFH